MINNEVSSHRFGFLRWPIGVVIGCVLIAVVVLTIILFKREEEPERYPWTVADRLIFGDEGLRAMEELGMADMYFNYDKAHAEEPDQDATDAWLPLGTHPVAAAVPEGAESSVHVYNEIARLYAEAYAVKGGGIYTDRELQEELFALLRVALEMDFGNAGEFHAESATWLFLFLGRAVGGNLTDEEKATLATHLRAFDAWAATTDSPDWAWIPSLTESPLAILERVP